MTTGNYGYYGGGYYGGGYYGGGYPVLAPGHSSPVRSHPPRAPAGHLGGPFVVPRPYVAPGLTRYRPYPGYYYVGAGGKSAAPVGSRR